MAEKEIYEFLDYQEYLKYIYAIRKKERKYFTYRYVAGKIDLDHSLVARIFQGKRHISPKSISDFAQVIGLDAARSEYFYHLVNYCKSEKPDKIKEHFEKMLLLQPYRATLIQESEYNLFKNWYCQAIHGVLEYYPFTDDFQALSKQLSPSITITEAKEAISTLQELKFIEQDAEGHWRPVNAHLTSGDRWKSAAIHSYHKEILNMALHSLDFHRKDQRDFSSLTLSLASEDLSKIKEVLKQTRESIIKIIGEKPAESSDAVYQLSLNFFPMSRLEAKR